MRAVEVAAFRRRGISKTDQRYIILALLAPLTQDIMAKEFVESAAVPGGRKPRYSAAVRSSNIRRRHPVSGILVGRPPQRARIIQLHRMRAPITRVVVAIALAAIHEPAVNVAAASTCPYPPGRGTRAGGVPPTPELYRDDGIGAPVVATEGAEARGGGQWPGMERERGRG